MAIELISKIKPKNNGDFKLVDVQDVEYNGKGLDEAIASGEFKGDKGDRGEIGPIGPTGPTGPKGDDGNDGFSPTVSIAEEADGVTVTVQNKDGEQTAKVKNGKDGKDYEHSEEFSALAEQVRADKESVEQSKTSIEQTVAQAEGKIDTAGTIAIQGVQNEGTTQTEKVTVEGTKQITEIQSKGEEILHSFPQDFPTQMATKLDKQQGTEHAGKALVIGEDGLVVPGEVQSGGDGIAIVNTASGESPLVIPDSAERVNKGFGLTGKTEQVQTSGKNLFDPNNNYEDLVWIRNDGEIVGGSNARTSDYIPVEQGNYAFQFDVINYNQMFVAGYNTGKQFVKIVGIISKGKCIIKIDDIQIETIRLSYTRESTRIQLERSETQTPYEPYTGGKPSPSPEYPQEIVNTGKWNEETQKYEVEVEISGNFFDITKVRDTKKLKNNKDGSLTITNSKTEGLATLKEICPDLKVDESYVMRLESTGLSYISIYGIVWDTGQSKTITQTMLDSTVFFYGKDGSTVVIKNIRITRNTGKNMEYTPYRKPQLLTLTSDRPITKWDRLVEQGGQIGWLYKHKIIEDFSTLVKDTEPIYGNDGGKYFSVSLQNASLNYDRSKIYSEVGIYGKDNKKYYIPQPLVASTIIHVSDTDTIMIAKEHMHYKVVYETVDSEFIPLPQSEQNAIRALTTYYPTTVISTDGGELDPDVEVTYTADTKNYIDNKFAQLQKSLINTQVQLL